MATYFVEKLGGIACFGGPSARIRSVGKIDDETLSEYDRALLKNLFSSDLMRNKEPGPDEFQYRITLMNDKFQKSIDLPESKTPPAIKDCVRDEFV